MYYFLIFFFFLARADIITAITITAKTSNHNKLTDSINPDNAAKTKLFPVSVPEKAGKSGDSGSSCGVSLSVDPSCASTATGTENVQESETAPSETVEAQD